jgi:surface carbohydrate biosynthesis protein
VNIYIHNEISVRELDSKLLIGVLAASRGHQVLISSSEILEKGQRRKILVPGIFHTKSLTPTNSKVKRHQSMIDNNFLVTSIDEEGGLLDYGYENYAKFRYSDLTLQQCSAIFTWGSEDVETLKKIYSSYASKIHKTGSARVDLWKTDFLEYWGYPKNAPKKPFLLVSTNMKPYRKRPFIETMRLNKLKGDYERLSNFHDNQLKSLGESCFLTAAFIEAIKYLSSKNEKYDIVVRPHPTDDINSWKIAFDGFKNVHVIKEGAISSWINKAFAVMHNGCTTAFETLISKKPLITYLPFEQKYTREITSNFATVNELGHCVKSLDELSKTINHIFETPQHEKNKFKNIKNPEIISKKIYLDDELSAIKIIKIWESLDNKLLSQSNNWIKFKIFLNLMRINKFVGNLLKKISLSKNNKINENIKFPKLNKRDIIERVDKLKNILSINSSVKCKILSERTILIKNFKK